MKWILIQILLSVFLSGCFRHVPDNNADDGGYADRIGVPRTERQLERKELVLALFETPESQREIAAVRSALEKEKIRLKIIRIAQKSALSALLRSGRVDLMAGGFTPEAVRSLHLLPVLSYTGSDGHSRLCLAVRHQDHILENLLGAVPPPDENSGENNP